MIGEQFDIRDKLKPIERRLPVLKQHIEQADIYLKLKGKKALFSSEQAQFTEAKNYLKDIMNGKTSLPIKTWKTEYNSLVTERKNLDDRYQALKGEVSQAEKIRKSVYSILRQEQREQPPQRAQETEL